MSVNEKAVEMRQKRVRYKEPSSSEKQLI